jgi:DNA uptake protein ComE-like DNA-binding protein
MWKRAGAIALMACVLCAAAVCPQPVQAPQDSKAQAKLPAGERLDVNRASLEELEKLPGVTHIWAERIVRFRPYHAKTDLRNQGVIPARVYHGIEDLIVAHRE